MEKDLIKYRKKENDGKSEANESQLLLDEFATERDNILADLHSKQNEVFRLTSQYDQT